MQIGNNSYIDIEIEDLDIKDFLKVEDLVDLQIIETAGTSLPIFYAAFFSNNKDVLNHFIENNRVKVTIGKTKETADTFTVLIHKGTPPNDGPTGVRSLVEFGGFILNRDYMVNFESQAYWGNSLLVAQRILYDYFGAKLNKGFQTNIDKTNENQVRWLRNNVTACRFLCETLIHMDIMPSFPLFAFDKYGVFHLNDFNKVLEAGATRSFVPLKPTSTTEIQYMNPFNVEDFKESYNLYSGYNKITEIWGTNKGIVEYAKSYNEPILASTKQTNMLTSSSRTYMNMVQSSNVHNTYAEAFVYNSNKLVALSSLQGSLELVGDYYKDLRPLELVTVSTGGENRALEGFYLIDTIRTQIDMKRGGDFHTYVYVTRDDRNEIENYIANPQKGIKIRKKLLTDVLNAVSQLRVAYALGQQIIDGRYMKKMLAFGIETKRNLLRSFNVAGVAIDFNSSSLLIKSLINSGNSLMNSLTSMIFPAQIAGIFRDFIIRKPSLRALFGRYIAIYVPYELRAIISAIANSIFSTTDSLNSIAKDNGIKVTAGTTTGSAASVTDSTTANIGGDDTVIDDTNTSEIDYTANNQEKIKDIINDFENNTSGLDIPFPIIDLTESQALLSDAALRDYVATQTIANLTNLGYMDGVNLEDFKNILLGKEPIDFNMIERINKNAGDTFSYRYWGTFNDLTELTDFYIKKCYKDKYRTIPCTKIINAMGNTKLFFACPVSETDMNFYINSKRVAVVDNLDQTEEYKGKSVIGYFDISLNYYDIYGNPVLYRVYYTNLGYNSTGVLFEIKRGGMV